MFLYAYLEWALIPIGLLVLFISTMWMTSRRHHLARIDPILKFLDTASARGLHPDAFEERVASYEDLGLLRGPRRLKHFGYVLIGAGVVAMSIRAARRSDGGMAMLQHVIDLTVKELANWPFWLWLTICTIANFAAKRAEIRSPRRFLIFAALRAACVAAGALLFLARAAQAKLDFGVGHYFLAAGGVVLAVISLIFLNMVPGLGRLFVSESVQMFWEGAVPSVLLVGLGRFGRSSIGCVAFAISALLLGWLLIGIPGLYFALTKQMGTARERRVSAQIWPALNAVAGVFTLQVFLAFLATAHVT